MKKEKGEIKTTERLRKEWSENEIELQEIKEETKEQKIKKKGRKEKKEEKEQEKEIIVEMRERRNNENN